jgi:GNAT superfamily N-acetyltransferase
MRSFRAATGQDIAAVVALVESAYRGDSSRLGWTTEADLLDGQRTDAGTLSALIADPDGRVMLALEDGVIVGTAHLAKAGSRSWFGQFAVQPRGQSRGTGSALLTECERITREEWGLRRMGMSVIWTRTELIDWYLRRGYAPTGEIKPFPYGDERFGLPKRDDLHFIVLAKDL